MIYMRLADKKTVKRILESYLIAFALMNVCGRKTTDVFTVIFFVVAYILLGKRVQNASKRDSLIGILTAGLFTAFYVLGNWEALTGGLTNKLFLAFYFGCTLLGLASLFYEGILCVLVNSSNIIIFDGKRDFPIKGFLLSAVLIFLCMLPFLLTNFPAVMTPDSLSQYRQVYGTEALNNHHPWAHTLLFSLFYHIGFAVTQETYSAIAFYTVAQMILVAACISYVWCALYEMGLKKKYCIIGMLLFVIYPYNLIYGVTIWKDILFSMSVLVLSITVFRIHCFLQEGKPAKEIVRDLILYIVCGLGMCILRHNGFYAFVAAAFCFLFIFKKYRKVFAPVTIAIVGMGFLINGPIMNIAGVTPGNYAYKLCIPLQQIGRVVADGCELSREETDALEKINTLDYIPENYQKGGADPMFAWVIYGNQDYLVKNKAEYFKLWVRIGLRYPGKYIQAFLDQTKGYWYPMEPEQVVYFGITENEDGLSSQAVLKGPVVIKLHEILSKLYTIFPLYGILYSMGGMFWLFLLLMAISLRNKKKSAWTAGIPLFFLMLTVFIAVPLVADIRYGYPLLVSIPVVAATTFYDKKKESYSLHS